jgi:hypothetical protein
MKKTVIYLFLLTVLFAYHRGLAQPFTATLTPPMLCYNVSAPGTNTINGLVVVPSPGATSYTWAAISGGNNGIITQLSGINGTNVAISFTSCGTYTVSCFAFVGATLVDTRITTAQVFCFGPPSLTVSAMPNSSICSGTGYSLSASGAISYTWSPGLFAGANVVAYPSANTCYTVIGVNSAGCTSSSVTCVTVAPSPTLVVTGSGSVCLGTSALLTVSGANTYTWSIGSTTPSISVMPLATTCYSVTGANANGCTAMAVGCITVDPTCSDVWPGDANSDGIVDNTDVFEIGLAFSNTGPPRNPGGNAYTSQFSNNWAGTISSGKNQCHADCNGNGTIDNGDTLAIFNNYSLTHAFKPSASVSNADITIVASQAVVNGGTWGSADILLGSANNPVNTVYGVAYDINFDNSLLETDSVYLVYTTSFLNASNPNVTFRKRVFNNGKLYTASVRTNGANVNGNGKIAELWFKVKTGLPDNTPLNFSVSDAKKINATGTPGSLTSGSSSVTVINIPTGIKTETGFRNTINLYPNPATNRLTIQSTTSEKISYFVFDVTGRKLMEGNFINAKNIDLSGCAAGAYMVRFESTGGTVYKKLVIDK